MSIININELQYEGIIQTRPCDKNWDNRESKSVTLAMTYDEANKLFVNDIVWSVEGDYLDTDGVNLIHYKTDLSDYALAGPIIDNRDGTVTIKMGKYTEKELLTIPIATVPCTYNEAMQLRSVIEEAAQSLSDEIALTTKSFYPKWEELVQKNFVSNQPGFKFQYDNNLYKTVSENSAFVSHWIPGQGTESLYMRIDEIHSGLLNDPIPYNGNMILENTKYYIQDNNIYLCIRDSISPVYNALSDLMGLYVEIVK